MEFQVKPGHEPIPNLWYEYMRIGRNLHVNRGGAGAYDWYNEHPMVEAALKAARPADWHRFVLERPHMRAEAIEVVWYYRNEADIKKGRVTSQPVGKYLSRHFKQAVAPHNLRDLCAEYGTAGAYKLPHDWDAWYAVLGDVRSCMRADRFCADEHPYNSYMIEGEWALTALRKGDAEHVARALVHEPSKSFVSVYGKGYLQLSAWLRQQGYTKAAAWPSGTKLLSEYTEELYLDGHRDRANQCPDNPNHYVLADDGEFCVCN